jgi:hypothetical protein
MPASFLVPLIWLAASATLFAGFAGLLPRPLVSRILPLDTLEPAGWLFFRHWAVLVCLCGVLLVWAALDPVARRPVLVLVAAEKAGFACLVFQHRATPIGRALRGGAVADLLIALIFAASLPS